MISNETLINIAREWLPNEPEAVLKAIIRYPGSDLARAFRMRVNELAGRQK